MASLETGGWLEELAAAGEWSRAHLTDSTSLPWSGALLAVSAPPKIHLNILSTSYIDCLFDQLKERK